MKYNNYKLVKGKDADALLLLSRKMKALLLVHPFCIIFSR